MLKHLDDFLLYLNTNNYSVETIFNYERDLLTFSSYLEQNKIDFAQVDRQVVEEYKAYLRSIDRLTLHQKADAEAKTSPTRPKGSRRREKLSSRSINRLLSSLRSYLKYLTKMGYKCPLSRDEVELIRAERKKARVAELNDLVKLIEAPTQFEKDKRVALRNRALLEVLFATGLRISELVSLDRGQVDATGRIFVRGKGRKERFVYLTPRAQRHLQKYLQSREDHSPSLFIPYKGLHNQDVTKRLSKNYTQRKIQEYVARLNINVPTSAHSLRHGFATYLAEQGASPVAIQILLGHESPATTDRYIHASDRFAQETHRKHHPLKR